MTDFSQARSAQASSAQASGSGDDDALQPLAPAGAGATTAPATRDAQTDQSQPLTSQPPDAQSPEPQVEQGSAPGSRWDVATKRTVVVILLFATVMVIWISRQVIPLLVVSGIIAYILSPMVDLLERIRIPRAVSTLALYLILVVGLLITPFLVAPILVNQLASLSFDVPTTAIQLWAWLGTAITNLPTRIEVLGFQVPLEWLTQQIESSFADFTFIPTLAEILNYIQQLISTATNVMSSTAAIGFSVVGGLFNVLVAVLVIFFLSLYLTKDAPIIRTYVESLFPQSYQSEWDDLLRRMGHIWRAFFRGQILLCIIIGVATGVALELAGMPGALVLGLVAAVLEVIPNLGPIIAMIPAVIIALIQGSSVLSEYGVNNFGFALITVAIYFIIQQLEAYILVPRIIGGNVRLHPVVVVAGVAIGYNVAGIAGAFFAAPVIATCRVLGAYIHAKLLDRPPFLNQPLPQRKPRRAFSYRRTVTGEQLAAGHHPLDTPVDAAPPTAAASTAAASTAAITATTTATATAATPEADTEPEQETNPVPPLEDRPLESGAR